MRHAALHILGNVPVDLQPVVPGFLDRRMGDVAQMRKALDYNDYGTIREIAHKLKGNGTAYGFNLITDIGKEIEFAAATQNELKMQKFIAELETFVLELQEALID